jgi:hypothetical protein
MSSDPARPRFLVPREVLFLAVSILAWAIFVLWLGKDQSWDFRNYHWYIPYAYLNHRMGFDIAVAHQGTFYNPTLDIPFYLLATHTHAWIALGTLGAVQGSNVVPLYLLARSTLAIEPRKQIAGAIALLGMTGGLMLGLAGTTYYDNVMSVFVLSGLAALVLNRETFATGPLLHGAVIAALAGIATGMAVGLKLPEAIFALGFGAALILMPGDLQHRASRTAAGFVGGVIGLLIISLHWWIVMDHVTGNPLFPYFNDYFHSPLALTASYRDVRFVPHSWEHILFFPLLFTIDWRVADDLGFQDMRVGAAYVLALATIPVVLLGKRNREPLVAPDAAGTLFAFAGATYVIWIAVFAIYRYILLLEMLAPLLIVCAVGLWPVSRQTQAIVLGLIALATVAYTRPEWLPKAPVEDPYVSVDVPPIPHPDKTLVVMAGEAPMGYLVPSLPHQIPVLRIDGWMIQPQDGSKLTAATKRRVAAWHGDIYLIANEYEIGRAVEALKDYGLSMRYLECADIEANLGGPYKFCPVERLKDKTP